MQKQTLTLSILSALVLTNLNACKVTSGSTSDGVSFEKAFTTTDSADPTPQATPTTTTQTHSSAPIGAVTVVALSSTETDPRSRNCVEIIATAIGASGTAVAAAETITFDIVKSAGTGVFFPNAACMGDTITSASIEKGRSTTKIFYKSSIPGTSTITARYLSVNGTAYSALFYGPKVSFIREHHTGTTVCNSYDFIMFQSDVLDVDLSLTDNATMTLRQPSSGNAGGHKVKIYDTLANCTADGATGLLSDTGSSTYDTPLTITPGHTWASGYIQSGGNGGSYTFTASISCTTSSSSTTTAQSGLSFTVDVQ